MGNKKEVQLRILVTFGDERFSAATSRIKREAVESGFFDKIVHKKESDLPEEYWKGGMTSEQARQIHGFWWYRWKPRVFLQALEESCDGDIVVWADAGCTINPKGGARLEECGQSARTCPYGILPFNCDKTEGQYTKGDVFAHLDCEYLRNTYQYIATSFIAHRSPSSISFIREWMRLVEECDLADGTPGEHPDFPEFVQHRYDQSVFSVLCKKLNILSLGDETDDGSSLSSRTMQCSPIWATRKRWD